MISNTFRTGVLLILCVTASFPIVSYAQSDTVQGLLEVVWIDARHDTSRTSPPVYQVVTADGERVRVAIPENVLRMAGGLQAIDGSEVVITGSRVAALDASAGPPPFVATSMRVSADARRPAVVANATAAEAIVPRPWISLLCKYADVAVEPQPQSYFHEMYAPTYPGFDHYWREASRDALTIAGSTASPWVTLPQPESAYVSDPDGDGFQDLDFDRVFADCTAAANAFVDFTSFVGMNIVLNTSSGDYAVGSRRFTTLEGQERWWAVTWQPRWSWERPAIFLHEMGHGLGLPHSSGMYGQVYDNQWDVMSDTDTNCERMMDPTYGCLGQHTIQYHRDLLSWIAPSEKFIATGPDPEAVVLERTLFPTAPGYLALQVPIDGSDSHYYSIELRQRNGYDLKLPGEGVIIHEVDRFRDPAARVVDSDGNGNTGDAGAIWTGGETFTNPAARITVHINSIEDSWANITITVPRSSAFALTVAPTPVFVNQAVTLTATLAAGTTGTVTFYDDDTPLATAPVTGTTVSFATSSLAPGWHLIRAEYSGDATYARGKAEKWLKVQIPTTVSVTSSPNPSAYGATVTFTAVVSPAASGSLNIWDAGETWLCGGPAVAGAFSCSGTVYIGTHTLTATFNDSPDHASSVSPEYSHVAMRHASAPGNVSATAVSTNRIDVVWSPVPGADDYIVWKLDHTGWSRLVSTGPPFIDQNVVPDRVYAYSVATRIGSDEFDSFGDVATTFTFADDPVAAGQPIRATHLQHLRAATNGINALVLSPPLVFADTIVPGATVKASHVAQLRAAMSGARAELLLPPIPWTVPTLVAGTTRVRAAQIQELRSAFK